MVTEFDVIVIGAGHNGLTAAAYLSKAGKRVLVLERRSVIGGAAVTESFHPGFRNSLASYTVSLLHPKVIEDLALKSHGLEILERPFGNFLPLPGGDYLATGATIEATKVRFARHSERDAARLEAYYAWLEDAANVLRGELLRRPPEVGGGLSQWWQTGLLANRLRKHSNTAHEALFELFTKSAAEILSHWFENPHIRALFGFDAIVGNFASPFDAGSGYVLLHHVFGEVNGKSGAWGHAVGGMGAISESIAAAARQAGAQIRCDSPVARVRTLEGRVDGVETDDGQCFRAPIVAANCTPKHLLLDLVPGSEIEPVHKDRIRKTRYGSGTFRMNVALSGLPEFLAHPEGNDYLSSGIIIAPTLDYMDRAYRDARSVGWSREPVVEMLIPSTLDDTLAPPGQHVASLFCQHVAPQLPDGQSWADHRDTVADLMIDTVDRYAPGFTEKVIARRVLTPDDLETELGLTGGDIFHGALSLSQLYSARPAIGMARYSMPLPGLYLCGAGAHPGGGVTGIPGHNAAHAILADT
ncbi:MAG: NAD(P)/FAD-dependent oxidoreductase [Pseudomonadota bacterium]